MKVFISQFNSKNKDMWRKAEKIKRTTDTNETLRDIYFSIKRKG